MLFSLSKQKPEIITSGLNAPGSMLKTNRHSSFQLLDPKSGKFWWLKDGCNRIGRGFDNDIVISDESISRRHARLTITGGNVFLEDLNSANGVFVGQERIGKSAVFVDTVIRLGRCELVLKRPNLIGQGAGPW
jgi:pSer/pThr/pTyr-binding forkhead associated (FHA) protein